MAQSLTVNTYSFRIHNLHSNLYVCQNVYIFSLSDLFLFPHCLRFFGGDFFPYVNERFMKRGSHPLSEYEAP